MIFPFLDLLGTRLYEFLTLQVKLPGFKGAWPAPKTAEAATDENDEFIKGHGDINDQQIW